MITIFEVQKYLEQQLNRYGNETLFKVYYWSKNYDKRYLEAGNGFYVLDEDNPITFKENKEYILSRIVDYTGSYEPIPNHVISNQEFSLEFYFPSNMIDEIKNKLNELSLSLRGKKAILKDDNQEDVRFIFNAEIPNFIGIDVQHLKQLNAYDSRFTFNNSLQYTLAEIRISFVYTETTIMGNDLEYEISWADGTEFITPLDNDLGNTVETDGEQELGKATTDHVAKTNDSSFTILFNAFKGSNLTEKLLDRILEGKNQDEVYTLKLNGISNKERQVKCIIKSVSLSGGLGENMIFNVTFVRSDEV